MRNSNWWLRCLVLVGSVLLAGPVPYTAPDGDLNRDGMADITDLQCEVRLFYALTLAGHPNEDFCVTDEECEAWIPDTYCRPGFTAFDVCVPTCMDASVSFGESADVVCDDPDADTEQCLGTTQRLSADYNCDGHLGNEDSTFLVAVIMNKLGGPGTPDHDSDGQLNFCDDDSDGDGDPDVTDCEPLDEAFSSIHPEICNGIDENCNGEIDEDLGVIGCGVAICWHEVPFCVGGVIQDCDPLLGAEPEVCNGVDDDCSGEVDDGLGETVCGLGQCLHAQQNCVDGALVECDPMLGTEPEIEDGIDNDCDGLVDEDFMEPGTIVISEIMQNSDCVPDSFGEWFEVFNPTDQPVALNGWVIMDDEEDYHVIESADLVVAEPGGTLIFARDANPATNGGVTPDYVYDGVLLTNGVDQLILAVEGLVVDEVFYDGGPAFPDPVGASMELSIDAMNQAVNDQGTSWCVADEPIAGGCGDLGTPGVVNDLCDADDDGYSHNGGDCDEGESSINPGADELCNDIDDNCDDQVDEGFPTKGSACDSDDLDFCENGTYTCMADGLAVECVNEDPVDIVDICDGVDNDCDGEVDEDFPTKGDACDGGDSDECKNGTLTCTDDGLALECINETETGLVDICDGLDNDCDGDIDEEFPLKDEPCDGADSDLCENGTYTCADNRLVVECVNEDPMGITELCDGLDNDCDGEVDEDFPTKNSACDGEDTDACTNGTLTCTADGLSVECVNESVEDIEEVCDDADNDCDGQVDEDWVCCLEAGQECGADGQCCSELCNVSCCTDSCPADEWICDGNAEQLLDYYCDELGGCAYSVGESNDCGESGETAVHQCLDQLLQVEFFTRGCSDGGCFETPGYNDVTTCLGTCSNWCNQGDSDCGAAPDGTQNAVDCGMDGWYCNGINRENRDYHCDANGGCVFDIVETQPGGEGCEVESEVGPCRSGQVQCVDGELGCVQTVFPKDELCDNIDNNCNGEADEGNVCCLELGKACGADNDCCSVSCNVNCCVGACATDGWVCNGNTREYRDNYCGPDGGCTYSTTQTENCGAPGYLPSYQCSGQTLQQQYEDKGCSGGACFNNVSWKTNSSCAGSCANWCNSGQAACGAAPSNTQASGCPEDGWYCNGINREHRDYFCNGSGGCTHNVTQTQPGGGSCSVSGKSGICKAGQQQCQGAALVCVQTVFPATETCDGADNDCDGSVDEGGVCGPEYLYYANMSNGDSGVCSQLSGKWAGSYRCWTKGVKLSYTNMSNGDSGICSQLGGKWGGSYRCWFKGTTGSSGSSNQGSQKSQSCSSYDNSPASMSNGDSGVCSQLGGQWGSSYQCYYTSGKLYRASMSNGDSGVCSQLSGKWGGSYRCWTKNTILCGSNMSNGDSGVCSQLGGKWGGSYRCWEKDGKIHYANMSNGDSGVCSQLGGKWGGSYRCWHLP